MQRHLDSPQLFMHNAIQSTYLQITNKQGLSTTFAHLRDTLDETSIYY